MFKVIKMSFDVYIVQFAWMRCLQYFLWSWVMVESIGFDQTVREAGQRGCSRRRLCVVLCGCMRRVLSLSAISLSRRILVEGMLVS